MTPAVVTAVATRLETLLVEAEQEIANGKLAASRGAGVRPPEPSSQWLETPLGPSYRLDAGMHNALVTYALTKLWSRSTSIGCCMATTTASCFLLQLRGVRHIFRQQPPNRRRSVKNHKSALTPSNALRRSIREGQEAGTYLVLDRDVAQRYSPFGCVPKADTDPAH